MRDEPPARSGTSRDRLLDALEQLRLAEVRMREVPESSEEFRTRARDLELQAREVFRLAESAEPDAGSDPREDRDPTG